ncbi:MAG: alanine dehydrogenase [Actinomycetota bacterium]|nr:alanine dehydrogenase [Acidobacteriota bacterium]MCL6094009.1 alanine dehydrogenase [Actinomycetota bacterium]MDA8167332.1 alanine dehydrogenase [Actinomycetota bacterium]
MIIGIPSEVEIDEYRVALTPAGMRELVAAGHKVLIQKGAGDGSKLPDEAYAGQGGVIVDTTGELFDQADLIVKVKDPSPEEVGLLKSKQTIFSFLHLAPQPELAQKLMDSGANCIAYETVEMADGSLPLLTPMSEIAGRMAAQVGAYFLEKMIGGRGILLGGVAGVPPAKVVVLGAGIVGSNAAKIAAGMLANVVVLDKNLDHLRSLHSYISGRLTTVMSTALAIEEHVSTADLVIGAVLNPGARAPKLVTEKMVEEMVAQSVIVDVSIDQGGCSETSHMTTHSQPTYLVHDVTHYCVGNIPGAVPITSTYALTNATLPYILELANLGVNTAVRQNTALAGGVNVMEGKITNVAVAEAIGSPYYPLSSVIPYSMNPGAEFGVPGVSF